jgi:predicted  nucleic acid-binding Zn-ribbon protein
MRETMSKFESLSGVITDLKVENSQYKLITDGKEREIDTIKNELFEAKQQNETIRQQLEGKAKEYETLMNYNEALLKQVESLQLSLEEEKRKGPIDKLFRR